MQDKDDYLYSNLKGLRLVPLKNRSCGTFGECDYYIADKRCQELFSISGPSHFVYDSDELIKIFEQEYFPNLRIKKLDTQGILDLFTEELPNKQKDWDPSSKANPYQQWLGDVFKIMKLGPGLELPNCPLLPIIRPSHKLVNLDSKNPLLINPDNNIPGAFIVDVLVKLGFCFTDIKSRALKRYVQDFNYSNVFNSINQTSQSQDISIKKLFNNAKLDDDDYKKLRKYVKSFIDVVKVPKETILMIIRELPIWPIRSSRKHKFISANDKGILPPYNLSCPLQDTDIFDVQNVYYNVLILLGVEEIEVYKFVKKYYSHGSGKQPTQQDVKFLKEILSLRDERIVSYLASRESIPNKSLKEFVKANTLFDAEVDIIFDDDKLLPLELQNSNVCHSVLLKMGLQRDLNGSTYVKYAHEIQKKINNNDDEIRSRAIKLIECLNVNYNKFSEYERKQLYKIDFIPSKKDLLSPYNKTSITTLGYESFNSLCFTKYQDICWTQTKFIYSDDVELPFDLRPGLKMVINHWIKLSTEVFPHETSGWEADKIYEIMEKIYQVVNDNLNLLDEDKIREFKLKDIKLFLNGDNPFDLDCWVSGKKLVFGLQTNLNGHFNNVHDHLLSFKKLLKTLGAEEVNDIKMDKILINYSQNDHLIQYLIESLQNQNSYHDVIFKIGGHEIYANRCVLSNFAKYFDWHFSEKPKDLIEINDVKHETYKVLLRWLYGMAYEDAVKNVFGEDFSNSGQRYLDFMLELLKVSHKFTHLNHIIQNNIMSKNIINVSNVKKIKEAIYNFNADHLKQCCEEYIEKNEKIIDAKDLCD